MKENKLTRFQALFIAYLRLECKCDCSWRSVAAHFNNRYNKDGSCKLLKEREDYNVFTYGGNQLEGMILCDEASKILKIKIE